jgi:hypothetical protein
MKVAELLERIAAQLETRGAPAVWDAKRIGAWLGLSEDTVSKKVVTRGDFPAPHVPTGEMFGRKVWFADEVVQWARENRAKLPKRRERRQVA